MHTLAIETATEACSVALFDGGTLADARHEVLGRGHAERLVPLVAELPDRGRADRIIISLGPGSFTGTRIGLAAARALGLAWGVPVLGYPTLALVAAMARREGAGDATVCMTGGHGEWFVQDFGADGLPQGDGASLAPDAAAMRGDHAHIAGNKAEDLVALLSPAHHFAHTLLPDARHALAVPEAMLSPARPAIRSRSRCEATRPVSDLDAIMAVMETAFEPLWREAWTRRQVEDSLALPSGYCLLANDSGRPLGDDEAAAGFILARRATDEVELLLIGVRPKSRGHGVGRELMVQFVDNARNNGVCHLFLEMRYNNPAEHLYRSIGFNPIGRRRNYYRTTEGNFLDAVTFGMDIDQAK